MNKEKKIRYTVSLILVIAMVFLAEYTNEREIIFPEIVALTIGAWIADKQPWRVGKIQLVLLMTISSIVGVCIVKYIGYTLMIKVLIGLIFTGVSLKITKTTLVPMISACILPILLQTETLIYPIAVCVMSVIIVIVQYIMEKTNIREINNICYENKVLNREERKKETVKLIKILVVIMIFTYISVGTNNSFLIAPPLIVAFVELTDIEGKARKKPKKVMMLFVIAALLGTICRVTLSMYLGWPLWVSTAVATAIIFVVLEKYDMPFPPVGAITLLPMLLDAEKVMEYPIQVIIGSLLFVVAALIMFRKDDKNVSLV